MIVEDGGKWEWGNGDGDGKEGVDGDGDLKNCWQKEW